MRNSLGRLLIGAALALSGTNAVACTCDDPMAFSAAEVDKAARYLVASGFVVADVERLESRLPGPYRYRLVRQQLGARLGPMVLVSSQAVQSPDGTWLEALSSCASSPIPLGATRTIVLLPILSTAERPSCGVLPKGDFTEWRDAGLCTGSLIDNPAILRRAVALQRAQAGVSRSKRPPSSSR